MIDAMAQWERLDDAAPAPTFFARPAFARALNDAWPHLQPTPLVVSHEGGRYTVPLVRARGRLGLTSGIGFPLGGYSCVLDESGKAAEQSHASAVLAHTAAAFDIVDFEPWPLGPQPRPADASSSARYTAVIDCGDGMAQVAARMRGVARRMSGQALRRGLRCRRSVADEASVARYYAMLEETSRRWERGTPTIPRRLLDAVFHFGGADAELWFAEVDGECVAGCVALFGRDELFVWSAAMRREYAAYRPSNALNMRLLEHACERGIRWYNIGSSAGAGGVERFKQSLGAAEIAYASLHFRSRGARVHARVRAALRGKVGI